MDKAFRETIRKIYSGRSKTFWDVASVITLSVVIYVIAKSFDIFDNVYLLFLQHEDDLYHEIAVMTGVVIVLLIFVYWRRIKELEQENERRKDIEKILREERSNLQAILESTPYGVIVIDKDKTIMYANQEALRIMGYDHMSAIVGRLCHETLCPSEADKCPILDLGQVVDKSEKILIRSDQTEVPILKTVVPLMFDDEEVLLEAFVDISRRKEAENFVNEILETVDEAFLVIDKDYKILSANRAYCDQSKVPLEDIVGRHCYEISHGIDIPCFESGEECAVRNTFITDRSHSSLHVHKSSKGEEIYVETKSFPVRDISGKTSAAIEIINDITEKNKLEEQLRQSQKLEAIGTLTGGVAHEFNNILTAIIGYGEFLQEGLKEEKKLKRYADHVMDSARRAARLTEGLLTYSRKQRTNMGPFNINDVIRNSVEILSTFIGKNIELRTTIIDEDLIVVGDISQIEQVFMNLSANAADAMPDGGVLTIQSELLQLDNEFVNEQFTIPHGKYILCTVSDTGIGMDKETQQKIFEPFFTTKGVGRGTGLGLSMVYGIVKKHKGYINVESETDKGTVFRIYLPLSESRPEKGEPADYSDIMRGDETILIAEDDQKVRVYMKEMLESAGYRVIEAMDGDEALIKYSEHRDEIDLLILDVVMPKRKGLDVYRKIKKMRSDIEVIFVSGYLTDDESAKEIIKKGYTFLPKPVDSRDMFRKIRQVIG